MTFPFGKPILVMIIAALLSGVVVATRRPVAKTDLTIWTFAADRGYELDPSILASYRKRTGLSVAVKVLNPRGLDTRLLSLFMQSANDSECPDVVEVEVGSVGKFFRPPVDQIGFLPWNDYLDQTDLRDQFSKSRMSIWTGEGQVFGLPQDIHPVSLTYRKDLFDTAGVDPSKARTWSELQQLCLQFQTYWHSHGEPRRHAMELQTHATDTINMMLQQRHVNLLDSQNRICIADPKVAQTLAFYSGLVTGDGQVGGDANPAGTRWANDISQGDLCMLLTPDWRATELRQFTPDLQGKLAMMPLPRFDSDDAPTASWGGTMMAIPRRCAHPAEARALAVFLTTSIAVRQANRRAGFDLIPPLPTQWSNPMFHQPDPFYADHQAVDDLFISLARQLPPRYVTPFTALAETELDDVLSKAVDYRRVHGDAGLTAQCQAWLDVAATELARIIQFGTFNN